MLRLLCRVSDGTETIHTQGPVQVSYRTFDVNLPEVEAFLRQTTQYGHAALNPQSQPLLGGPGCPSPVLEAQEREERWESP